MLPQPRRRWAFFPGSVISDYENAPALLYRAMADEIARIGDEARFYEERGNPWLRNMLTQVGASGFREFQTTHPNVDYVTFDPRTGPDLADWINRVLATVDIVLVDPIAPRDIVRWVGELTRPHLHTFLVNPGGRHPSVVETVQNVHQFSGICVLNAQETPVVAERDVNQPVIEFGPYSPDGLQNGNAARHVRQTAERLVRNVVETVDHSLVQNAIDDSDPHR